MALYLACPYSVRSSAMQRDGGTLFEVVSSFAFKDYLATRKSIRLVRGHGGPTIARVQPFETERGLFFEYDGPLPDDWRGWSVRFAPTKFRRIGPRVFLLLAARLKHIALVSGDYDIPVYSQTRTTFKESHLASENLSV